jgi:DNA polymerase-1
MIVTFDVETSTINKGNPFTASGKMVSYSVKRDKEEALFYYYTDIDFMRQLKELIGNAKLIVGFNVKFDFHWARRYGVDLPSRVRVWDCQIAEFLITGQKGMYPSLDNCLAKYDLGKKDDKIAEYWGLGVDTTDIPKEELELYNNLDVELTYKLYLKQQEVMTEEQKRLCLVMGLDLLVLEEMEWNGIKVDVELCKQKAEETAKKLKEVSDELLTFSPTPDINLDSGQQLSILLYGGKFDVTRQVGVEPRIYKSGPKKGVPYDKPIYETVIYTCNPLFKPLPKTETKLKKKLGEEEITIYETNEDVLKQLKKPTKVHKQIVDLLLERAEAAKLLDTYYGKLPELLNKMEWGDYLHGQFNQCVAATGRLSSSSPNLQNFSGEVDKLLISRYD